MKNSRLKNKIIEIGRTFDETIQLNKKVLKIQLLKESASVLAKALEYLGRAIQLNNELAHRTELWEEKHTFNYQINNWNDIKKVRGYITRYYNTICRIKRSEEFLLNLENRKIEEKKNGNEQRCNPEGTDNNKKNDRTTNTNNRE